MNRQSRVLFAVVALVSFFAMAVGAAADYAYKGTFSAPGSEPGQLEAPGRAAVEQSTGNLFVVDSGNDRVQVFRPEETGTATYLTSFGEGELSEPWGVAIAETGGQTSVYVADAGNERIVKYDSDEAETPSFAPDASFETPSQGSGSEEVGSFKAALAIDPTSGDLLVADTANKLVQRFEADGDFVSAFDGSDGAAAFEGPIDLAVNSEGDIYVIDANGPNIGEQEGTSKALRYDATGAFQAELTPVGPSQRPATVAVNLVTDEVMVSGEQDAVYTNTSPQIFRFDSDDQPLPFPAVGALYDTVSGLAVLAGSDEDRLYVVLDVGRYFGGVYGQPEIQVFRQPHPTPPAVLAQGAMPASDEVTLTAAIDTGSSPTQYRFQWGPTSAYGAESATKTLPASEEPAHISVPVAGLTPGTTYHFRAIATNALGTATGEDRTFTTAPEVGPDACPNAEIRGVQDSTELPECRAFEMVSPVDKNGNEVTGFYTVQAAPADGRVAYASTGAFPGSESSLPQATYLSYRDGSGWRTRPLSPPQINGGDTLGGVARDLSLDLGRGMTFSRLALAPGAVEGESNIYMQNSLTGEREYVGGSADPWLLVEAANSGGSIVRGGSDDYSHVVFSTSVKLTDDAPDGVKSIYEATNGEIRLVSILPNGEASTGDPEVGKQSTSSVEDRAVSADGKRIFFGTYDGRVFARIEGDRTIEISASEVPVTDPNPSALFGAASDDGGVVFFTAKERLTFAGEPNLPGEDRPRLFRYAGGSLEQIAIGGPGYASAIHVLSVTPDGSTAFFAKSNSAGETVDERRPTIYRWRIDEGVSEVARLEDLGGFEEKPVRWSMSASGRFAAFQSLSRLTPDAQLGPGCEVGQSNGSTLFDHCYSIYVYDAETGSVDCASCGGGAPRGHSTIGGMFEETAAPPMSMSRHLARGIANDGTVYFDSPDRLTSNDSDGKRDTYQWQGGARTLLTPRTASDAVYADADRDGSTVYVLTASRLVAQDVDSNSDLYAVRRGGGFSAQNPPSPPPSCQGEACQKEPAPTPIAAPPGSLRFSGPGNVRGERGGGGFRVAGGTKIHGTRGKIRISVPNAGRVIVRGPKLKRRQHRFRTRGQAALPVALTAKASSQLRRKGRVRVLATVAYRPQEGKVLSKRVSLTFVSGKGR